MKLFTLEIKRVLRTKTTWLLLAASLALSGIMAWLPVTFESRYIGGLDGIEQTEVKGMAAIRLVRDAQADLGGVITQEQLRNVLETAQKTLNDSGKAYTYQLSPGIYQENILPIAPLLSRITEVYADPETGMAPGLTDLAPKQLDHYYESCVTHLDDLMNPPAYMLHILHIHLCVRTEVPSQLPLRSSSFRFHLRHLINRHGKLFPS